MEKDEALHARASVIASINALIDTFLKKASREDVDTLAGSQMFEDGMLLFRDRTSMSIEVRVTFGEHLDAEATAKFAGDAPATLVQPGFEQSIPIAEVIKVEFTKGFGEGWARFWSPFGWALRQLQEVVRGKA